MNERKQRRLRELCELICGEKDPDKFSHFIAEIDALMDTPPFPAVKPPTSLTD